MFKEPPRTYVGYTAAELQFTRNTADCIAAPRRNFEADSAAQCFASHMMLVLLYGYQHDFFYGLYGYENKDFFHGHINTQTILKFPDKHLESSNHSSTTTYGVYTAAELQLTRNTAYCIAAPRRNFEADSVAP